MLRELQEDLWIDNRAITVQRGDIWQLGKHRLMCADCTNAQDVARLFDTQKFTLCFTSPPYSDQRDYTLGSFNWHDMMCQSFDQIVSNGEPDCHILINLGLSHKNRKVDMYWLGWLMHCNEMGWPLFGWYVWHQGSGLPGAWGGRLAPAHEFVFHFNQKLKYPNKWIETKEASRVQRSHKLGLRDPDGIVPISNAPDKCGQTHKIPDSVIRINREAARGLHTAQHPAVFPVALLAFIMQTWSQEGDIVYEPFSGSGTSIIAGESLKRTVYAMDIEPRYCELAIQRWQFMTCQKAQKLC